VPEVGLFTGQIYYESIHAGQLARGAPNYVHVIMSDVAAAKL
jgi:hypothetical protein